MLNNYYKESNHDIVFIPLYTKGINLIGLNITCQI